MSKTSSVSSSDVSFVVDGYQLSGVTDVDGSYSITETPINVLGFGYVTPTLSAPFQGGFNINRNMVSKDVLLAYTGEDHLNGAINYGDKNFAFTSGYLTNYSIACAVEEVPTISNQITVFGEIGGQAGTATGDAAYLLWNEVSQYVLTTSEESTDRLLLDDSSWVPKPISATKNHPAIQIPQKGSISINCTGASTNRISRFNYSISCPREPIYTVNNPFPVQVNLGYPLEIDATFTLEIDDYQSRNAREYLVDHNKDDIEILIKDPADNSIIQSYSIVNPELVGETINTSYGSDASIELKYKGYLNKR
jgi:hypothetical protein